MFNNAYTGALAGLVIGIALTLLWPDKNPSHPDASMAPVNNEPLVASQTNPAIQPQNPFSTPKNTPPDNHSAARVDVAPQNHNFAETQILDIQTTQQLLNSLQWLQQTEHPDIENLATTLFAQYFSTPDHKTSSIGSSLYQQTWLHALITRWLETDATAAINFLIGKNNGPANTEQQYRAYQMLEQLLQNHVEHNPLAIKNTLASLDPRTILNNQLLLDLQIKIDPETVLAQLASLPDSESKMMVYARYTHQLAADDPEAAIAWLLQHSDSSDRLFRSISPSIFYQWAESDPRSLIAHLNSNNAGPIQQDMLTSAYISLASENPLEALSLVNQLPEDRAQMARMSVISDWAFTDPEAASDWTQQAISNGEIDAQTFPPFLLANFKPAIAMAIADLLPAEQRNSVLIAMAQRYVNDGQQPFEEFLSQLPDPQSRQTARLAQLPLIAETNPLEALNQLASAPADMQTWLVPQIIITIDIQSPQLLDEWLGTASVTDALRQQIAEIRHSVSGQGGYSPTYWQQEISLPVEFSGKR